LPINIAVLSIAAPEARDTQEKALLKLGNDLGLQFGSAQVCSSLSVAKNCVGFAVSTIQ
jgi:hypothetical protein